MLLILAATVLCLISPFPEWDFSNNFCSELLNLGHKNEWNSALFCGDRIQSTQATKSLRRLGLVHLFVVSGLHLTALGHLSESLLPKKLIFPFLFGFSWICGMQPPVVRAFADLCLRSKLKQLSFPSDLRIFFTSITCMIIFPSWAHSISFLLSWSAALCIFFAQHLESKGARFITITSVMTFPILIFAIPDPRSMLVSICITPLILYVIFPIILLSLFFKPLDELVSLLPQLLEWVSTLFNSPSTFTSIDAPVVYLWGLLTLGHILAAIQRSYLK